MEGYNPQIIHNDGVRDLTKKSMFNHKKQQNKDEKTVEKRFTQLKIKRDPFLSRARTFSNYTVPNLYPINSGSDNQGDGTNTTGWQSFGSEVANSLRNKLVMTLFPPHASFAKLELSPKAKELLGQEDINVIQQQKQLINAEKQALIEHENLAGRVGIGEAMEHLLIGGTTCIYVPDDEESSLINYPLDRFVNRRDKSGNLLELIIEESKSLDMFEPSIQMVIKAKHQEMNQGELDEDDIKLYTKSILRNGFYIVTQEVVGVPVGKAQRIKKDKFRFIVLRWKTNYGEDYGRSHVEQYQGDFHVIQFLSEAIAKGMILMADVKYLIKPGSVTDVDHLIESPTGEFIYGNIDDIGVLQLEKYADFTPIANILEKYENRVSKAFLKNTVRNSERTTMFEIRQDALQLEKSLGGTYSLLAITLQRPYFKILLDRIGFDLPEGMVNTVITTGIEALSKETEADKFQQWTEAMIAGGQLPEGIQARMKWGDFSDYTSNQLSLDLPFLMSDSELAEKQQAEQEAQQQQQMTEGAAKSMPTVAGNLTQQPKG